MSISCGNANFLFVLTSLFFPFAKVNAKHAESAGKVHFPRRFYEDNIDGIFPHFPRHFLRNNGLISFHPIRTKLAKNFPRDVTHARSEVKLVAMFGIRRTRHAGSERRGNRVWPKTGFAAVSFAASFRCGFFTREEFFSNVNRICHYFCND